MFVRKGYEQCNVFAICLDLYLLTFKNVPRKGVRSSTLCEYLHVLVVLLILIPVISVTMESHFTLAYLLQLIKSLIVPGWIPSNCTAGIDQPSASEFLSHLKSSQLVYLIIGSTFTLLIIALGFVHWFFTWHYITKEKRQNKMYFLISLLPVSASCCLVGMYMPRTATIVTSLGILYLLLCLFVLVSLIRHLAGGRTNLAMYLRSSAPVVRAFIVASNVIAIAEYRQDARKWLQLSDIGSVASLLLAIFGVHTLARLTGEKLSEYKFMKIFRLVDFALLLFTAQQPMIFENILVRFNVFECGPVLSPHDSAKFMCNFVIICEMLGLSLLATFYLKPSKNALFDMYLKSSSLHDDRSTEEAILNEEYLFT
uniref:Transmembrane protein n=1 Tax=Steinernema glaseri TaxID=37863 RepID=A0A1I8A8Y6_9BILA